MTEEQEIINSLVKDSELLEPNVERNRKIEKILKKWAIEKTGGKYGEEESHNAH